MKATPFVAPWWWMDHMRTRSVRMIHPLQGESDGDDYREAVTSVDGVLRLERPLPVRVNLAR